MFKKDNIKTGFIVGLGSIIVVSAIICLVFFLFEIPFQGHLRFFLLAFVPDILLLRYYIKKLHYMRTGQTITVILFLLMLALFVVLFKTAEIQTDIF